MCNVVCMLTMHITITIQGLFITITPQGLFITITIQGLFITITLQGLFITITIQGLFITITIQGLFITITIQGLFITITLQGLFITWEWCPATFTSCPREQKCVYCVHWSSICNGVSHVDVHSSHLSTHNQLDDLQQRNVRLMLEAERRKQDALSQPNRLTSPGRTQTFVGRSMPASPVSPAPSFGAMTGKSRSVSTTSAVSSTAASPVRPTSQQSLNQVCAVNHIDTLWCARKNLPASYNTNLSFKQN